MALSLRQSFRTSIDASVGMGNRSNFLTGLRDDDSLLRTVFFGILKHHHPNLAAKVWTRVTGSPFASCNVRHAG
jgi:phosphoenolpyruvate carboxylase